jgi:predicted ATP-grasp superfamily ATP-dependent carboligase
MISAAEPGKTVLIAAFSGRALASAVSRAGYTPLVADMFADADTRGLAAAWRQVEGSFTQGFNADAFMDALAELAKGRVPTGLVYGAGFEASPDVLAAVAEHWPILGNPPEAVARVKHPEAFARACAKLGVPHPEISCNPLLMPAGWLQKQYGGAGGAHIRLCTGEAMMTAGLPDKFYFQREVKGRPVSALFLAAKDGVHIIGFSGQWRAPSPQEAFRFGGAVRPARISSQIETQLTEAVLATAREFGLIGLGSADFLVDDGGGWWLLEINPRPSATLDIFDSDTHPLFALHMAAVRGAPLPATPRPKGAFAMQILYVLRAKCFLPQMQYPDWIVDRPLPGTYLEANAPLCTVLAYGEDACKVKTLCTERAKKWLATVEECG